LSAHPIILYNEQYFRYASPLWIIPAILSQGVSEIIQQNRVLSF
jgi:hypothetical protein